MNIGKDNRHPKYVCDKCKEFIYYEPQKGFVGLNKYYKQKPLYEQPKKSFDLCEDCEKKFREWLDQLDDIEIIIKKRLKDKFPVYKEEGR